MAFHGTVALITGAGSGMGLLAARNMASANPNVQIAALDINTEGLAKTAQDLSNIQTWACDITDADEVARIVGEVESQLGPIDRLFNCAAIMPLGLIAEQDPATKKKLMDVNVLGLMNVTSAVLPGMLKRGSGDFVSFASMAGHIPAIYCGVYCASKAAVAIYNEIMYQENRDSGVRFASVTPPVVNTPLLQQGHDTVWPKALDAGGEALNPQEVLDEIEHCLEKGEFMVLPGKQTKIGLRMRRFFPSMIWKSMRKSEGFPA